MGVYVSSPIRYSPPKKKLCYKNQLWPNFTVAALGPILVHPYPTMAVFMKDKLQNVIEMRGFHVYFDVDGKALTSPAVLMSINE